MKNIFSNFNQYFLDKRNRVIYYDSKNKVGYIVHDKDRVYVNFFHNRLMVSALLCIGLFAYKVKPITSIVVSILAYLLMDLLLKKRFLPSYTMLANYNIEKEKALAMDEEKKPLWFLVGRLILSIAFLALVYYAQREQEPYQTIALGIAGLYFLIMNLKDLYSSFKN